MRRNHTRFGQRIEKLLSQRRCNYVFAFLLTLTACNQDYGTNPSMTKAVGTERTVATKSGIPLGIDSPDAVQLTRNEDTINTNMRNSRLKNFLSNKEMRSSNEKSGDRPVERFLRNGNWEEISIEIDITRRTGSWFVMDNKENSSDVCVNIETQDGRKLSRDLQRCRRFDIDYNNSRGIIHLLDGSNLSYKVYFSEYTTK